MAGAHEAAAFTPLSHPWNTTLRRCLNPDPAKRFRDAGEVAAALEPSLWRRWWMPAAATKIALAAGLSAAVTWQRATAPAESIQLAMLPLGSDPGDAALAERRIARYRLKPTIGRLSGGKRARVSIAPAATPHTTNLLRGTITRENGKVIVHAFLSDARTHADVVDKGRFEYSPADLHFAPTAMTQHGDGKAPRCHRQAPATVNSGRATGLFLRSDGPAPMGPR